MTTAEVARHLGARPTGPGKWQARCPAHDDHSPSLSIAEGREGFTLIHCWAGCSTSAVLAALGLTWRDLGGTPAAPAERVRQRRAKVARIDAEAVARRRQADLSNTNRAVADRATALVSRLAALEWADKTPAYPGEADALNAEYHAAMGAAHDLEVSIG